MTKDSKIKIVEFDPKYTDAVDAIEIAEWYYLPPTQKNIDAGMVYRVALEDDKVVGAAYGRKIGDLFVLDTCIVEKEYRGTPTGFHLSMSLLEYAKEQGCSNLVVELLVNGDTRTEKVMRRFGFKEVLRVKGWWKCDTEDPCKRCGGNPCDCVCVFFLKELK